MLTRKCKCKVCTIVFVKKKNISVNIDKFASHLLKQCSRVHDG